MEGLELEQGMRQDFSSAQWPSLPYQGQGLIPSSWSRSPEVQAQAVSVPFKCVFSSLPAPSPLPQRGAVVKQVEPVQVLSSCQPQTEVRAVSDAVPV